MDLSSYTPGPTLYGGQISLHDIINGQQEPSLYDIIRSGAGSLRVAEDREAEAYVLGGPTIITAEEFAEAAEDDEEAKQLLARLNGGDVDEDDEAGIDPDEAVGQEARNQISVYQEITDSLVAGGVPREQIGWIHDAKTPAMRQKLFENVNKGVIRFLLGSTSKMGVGVNVQERCYAVHHLTTPWRPCDVKQADGRIWRPGNRFPEVWIFRYVASPSFDGFSWQGIEVKAKFEDMFLRGDPNVRISADIDENIVSAGEVKAIASGDPRVVQKVRLEHELDRLQQQRKGWEGTRNHARLSVVRADADAAEVRERAEWFAGFLPQRIEDRTLVFFGESIDSRDKEQQRAIGKKVRDTLIEWAEKQDSVQLARNGNALEEIGTYRGLPLWAKMELDHKGKKKLPFLMLASRHERHGVTRLSDQYGYISDTKEVIPRLDAAAADLDTRIETISREAARIGEEAAKIRANLEIPWEHARTYRMMDLGLRYLNAVLNEDTTGTETVIAEVLGLAESEGLDIDAIIKEGQQIEEKGPDLSMIRVQFPPLEEMQAEAEAEQPAMALGASTFAPAPTAEAPRLDTERMDQMEQGSFISLSIFADPRPIANPPMTLEVAALDLKDMATEAARKRAELENKKRKQQQDAGQTSFFSF